MGDFERRIQLKDELYKIFSRTSLSSELYAKYMDMNSTKSPIVHESKKMENSGSENNEKISMKCTNDESNNKSEQKLEELSTTNPFYKSIESKPSFPTTDYMPELFLTNDDENSVSDIELTKGLLSDIYLFLMNY